MLSQNYCIHARDLLSLISIPHSSWFNTGIRYSLWESRKLTAEIYASTNWHMATVTYLEIDTFTDCWYVAVVEVTLLWNVIQKQNPLAVNLSAAKICNWINCVVLIVMVVKNQILQLCKYSRYICFQICQCCQLYFPVSNHMFWCIFIYFQM